MDIPYRVTKEEIGEEDVEDMEQIIFEPENIFEPNNDDLKKKPGNPENWKKNINKRRKMEGLPYETKRGVQAPKIPKEIDCSNCKFNCSFHFPEEERRAICASFWKLDYCRKKDFILMNVKSIQPKRRRPRTGTGTPRISSRIFHFFKRGMSTRVCQNFFIKTLNICNQSIKKAFDHKNPYTNFFDGQDCRGKHSPVNKSTPEQLQVIKTVIDTFPYDVIRRKNKIKKVFTDPGLTFQKMFNAYKNHCEMNNEKNLSIKTFVRIIRNEYPEYSLSVKRERSKVGVSEIKKEVQDQEIIEESSQIMVISNMCSDERITDEIHDSDEYYDENIIEEDPNPKDDTIIYDPSPFNGENTSYTTFEVQVLPITAVTEHNGQQLFF